MNTIQVTRVPNQTVITRTQKNVITQNAVIGPSGLPGNIVELTAAEDIPMSSLVAVYNSKLVIADVSIPERSIVIGVVTTNVNENSVAKVYTNGIINTTTTFMVGDILYAGVNGEFTTDSNQTTKIQVGVAIGANQVLLRIVSIDSGIGELLNQGITEISSTIGTVEEFNAALLRETAP